MRPGPSRLALLALALALVVCGPWSEKKPRFPEKSRKCLGPYDSAPRPQMSNGVQRLGQRAPLGHLLGILFADFPPDPTSEIGKIWKHYDYPRLADPVFPVLQWGNCQSRKSSEFWIFGNLLCLPPSYNYCWSLPSESPRIENFGT